MRHWAKQAGLDEVRRDAPSRARLKWLVRVLVLLLVVWGLGRHVEKLAGGVAWSTLELRPGWLLLSAALYAAGMCLSGYYFHLVLGQMGARVSFKDSLCAFWASQLGKYVPGKAMVIVIRCGLLKPRDVARSVTAIASLYETPMLMAVGSVAATAVFGLGVGPDFGARRVLLLASGGLALALCAAVAPPVFRRIAKVVTLPFRNADQEAPSASAESTVRGLLLLPPAWSLIGGSLVACAYGLSTAPIPLSVWPLLLAAAGLGLAAGFIVVVLPSGLGVREVVIVEALAPTLGTEHALVTAVVLRMVWVVVEAAGAAVSYGVLEAWPRKRLNASASSSPR